MASPQLSPTIIVVVRERDGELRSKRRLGGTNCTQLGTPSHWGLTDSACGISCMLTEGSIVKVYGSRSPAGAETSKGGDTATRIKSLISIVLTCAGLRKRDAPLTVVVKVENA